MATVRARALSLSVLLAFVALCLAASAAEQQQPANRYISYAGVPRTRRGGNAAGAPRGNGRSVLSRCKTCRGQPPAKAAAETAAAESKGADIGHAAVTMAGAKTAAAAMTGAKTADAGSEGGYITPAAP